MTIAEDLFGFRYHGDALLNDVDSRRVQMDLDGAPRDVPVDVTCGLHHMRVQLGYNFASTDFIEDNDGQLWFLDLNPSGQWAFLEDAFDVPLSRYIVRLGR